jgi:hypothetical protein
VEEVVVDMLDEEEQQRLSATAEYMVARGLRGEDIAPPAHWTPAMIDGFARVIATEEGRSALLAMALRGWQRNVLAARASAPL